MHEGAETVGMESAKVNRCLPRRATHSCLWIAKGVTTKHVLYDTRDLLLRVKVVGRLTY